MPLRATHVGATALHAGEQKEKNMANLQFDKEMTALLVIDPYNVAPIQKAAWVH
jgi:hypothetical protein